MPLLWGFFVIRKDKHQLKNCSKTKKPELLRSGLPTKKIKLFTT